MLEEFKHEIFDCTRCGFCREWHWKGIESVCPIYPFTPGFEVDYARGKVRIARALMENEVEITDSFIEHAFMCTLCGSCEEHCPIGIPLFDILHALRVDLVEAGYVLPAHRQIVSNIETYHNPYGPEQGMREGSTLRSAKTSVLYFPGCTSTHEATRIARSTTSILDKLGADYTLLDEEACCGHPLYRIGQMSAIKQTATKTLELIKQKDPDIVLTSCPACTEALRLIYPEKLGLTYNFEVQHITEFLSPIVQGKLVEYSAKVTWHDPCILGRRLGIYDKPREILHAIPGLELIEMYSNREDTLCCGAGGGVNWAFPDIAEQAAIRRLKQAKATGAQQLITSCPTCYVNFRKAIDRAKLNLQVKVISEIVNDVLDGG